MVRRKLGVVIRKAGRPRPAKPSVFGDQPSCHKSLHNGVTVHTADGANVGAGDRLFVDDDRQRLQGCQRQWLRQRLPEVAFDDGGEVWSRHQSQLITRFFESQAARWVGRSTVAGRLEARGGQDWLAVPHCRGLGGASRRTRAEHSPPAAGREQKLRYLVRGSKSSGPASRFQVHLYLHVSDAAHYRRMVRSAHAGCLQRQTVALFIGTQRRCLATLHWHAAPQSLEPC